MTFLFQSVDKITCMVYNKTEERTVADGYALVESFYKKEKPLIWTSGGFFLIFFLVNLHKSIAINR